MLAAPFAKPRKVPMLLWYVHWNADRALRAATRLCAACLTVDPASFPLDSPKVRAIGHGIDLSRFTPRGGDGAHDGPLRLVALGRTQPWKGLTTLLAGLETAAGQGLDAHLEIRGPSLTSTTEITWFAPTGTARSVPMPPGGPADSGNVPASTVR